MKFIIRYSWNKLLIEGSDTIVILYKSRPKKKLRNKIRKILEQIHLTINDIDLVIVIVISNGFIFY